MQDHHFEIRYVKAADNVAADFLSRNAGSGCSPVEEDGQSMMDLQRDDPQLMECVKAKKGLEADKEKMGPYAEVLHLLTLDQEGVLRIEVKPRKGIIARSLLKWVAPPSMQPRLIREAHNSMLGGHGGVFKTAERIKELYWWPAMDADIKEHVARCKVCQATSSKGALVDPEPGSHPQPTRPNQRVHVDLFGSLVGEDGCKKMILVATDAFTKIVRLSIIRDKTAETVAAAIMRDWIFIYGVPSLIFSDGGKEFCNELQNTLWKKLGVLHGTTTPYHPQCNGQAEVFNKTMVAYLRKVIAQAEEDTTSWEKYIGPLMFSHNTAVHKATMASPFYTMFGYDPKAPMWPDQKVLNFEDDVKGDPLQHLRTTQRVVRSQAHHNNQHYREQYLDQQVKGPRKVYTFSEGDLVWIRIHAPGVPNKKLAPQWEEGRIVEVLHDNVYRVSRPRRRRHKQTTANVRDLKPRVVEEDAPEEHEPPAPAKQVYHQEEEQGEESDFEEDWQSSDEEEEDNFQAPPARRAPPTTTAGPRTRARVRDLVDVVRTVHGINVEAEVSALVGIYHPDDSWSMEDIFKLVEHAVKYKTGEEFMFFGAQPWQAPQPPPPVIPPPHHHTGGGQGPRPAERTPPPEPARQFPPATADAKRAAKLARELKKLADFLPEGKRKGGTGRRLFDKDAAISRSQSTQELRHHGEQEENPFTRLRQSVRRKQPAVDSPREELRSSGEQLHQPLEQSFFAEDGTPGEQQPSGTKKKSSWGKAKKKLLSPGSMLRSGLF